MLEHQALWLGPWSSAGSPFQHRLDPGAALPSWVILEPSSRAFLGLVRRRFQTVLRWFGGITRPIVEVYETEDESLLFILGRTRGLGLSWRVADADDHRVGILRGYLARNREGDPIALFHPGNRGVIGYWRSPEGQELGTITEDGKGVLAVFHSSLDGQPLHKMVLLAMLFQQEAVPVG